MYAYMHIYIYIHMCSKVNVPSESLRGILVARWRNEIFEAQNVADSKYWTGPGCQFRQSKRNACCVRLRPLAAKNNKTQQQKVAPRAIRKLPTVCEGCHVFRDFCCSPHSEGPAGSESQAIGVHSAEPQSDSREWASQIG